ncbi:hypothetical protein GGX14DRAFT_506493 [Mycena pura]|uniref:SH3 domain-containing protein n=1 Tax=Mycena pura TaxID=153505 RepID=A0AAD6UPS9_9AGAR|nr:hypothetical protein GGX14DRAFT_506493 [Mycena pura]
MSRRLDFELFRTQYFFLVTTVLATFAWFLAFIFQAIATAQFSNGPIGVLWFAIFLQGFLNLGVILTIATDSIHPMRMQIAVFGGIATVFAVQGVEAGFFNPLRSQPALDAMGVGYLLFAIVDILWVLYFTSEEGSLAMHLFNRLGTGRSSPEPDPESAAGPAPPRPMRGQSLMTLGSTVGYVEKPNSRGVGGVDGRSASANSTGGGRKRSGSGGRKSLSSAKTDDLPAPPSAMKASPPPPLPLPASGGAGSPVSPPAVSSTSILRPVRALPAAAKISPGPPPPLNINPGSTAVSAFWDKEEPSPDDDDEASLPLPRARALHAYNGAPDDPNELSFKKGEILEIEDQEGKWWQARKADGTIGIAPSNYLVLLNS